MKKPYQIEAQRAVRQLEAMAADENPAVQYTPTFPSRVAECRDASSSTAPAGSITDSFWPPGLCNMADRGAFNWYFGISAPSHEYYTLRRHVCIASGSWRWY